MRIDLTQILIGIGLAIIVAAMARRVGSLSISGMLAAILVGGITFGFGGLLPAILLLTFFFTSSLLSRVSAKRKIEAATSFEKGGVRDHGQVLANGIMAAIFAALLAARNETIWLVGLAGALSAVNADTWSTELGVLARGKPRMITTLEKVEPGTSGAVTIEGSTAGITGAALIGLITGMSKMDGQIFLAATLGGVLGATLDSYLGATVQVIYSCPTCERQTEQHPTHSCGDNTIYSRGWSWLSNDHVNFLASLFGSINAIGFWLLLK